MMFGNDK